MQLSLCFCTHCYVPMYPVELRIPAHHRFVLHRENTLKLPRKGSYRCSNSTTALCNSDKWEPHLPSTPAQAGAVRAAKPGLGTGRERLPATACGSGTPGAKPPVPGDL